jgi:hypothetical protein
MEGKSNVSIEGRSEEVAVSTLERETSFMTEAFVVLLNFFKKIEWQQNNNSYGKYSNERQTNYN